MKINHKKPTELTNKIKEKKVFLFLMIKKSIILIIIFTQCSIYATNNKKTPAQHKKTYIVAAYFKSLKHKFDNAYICPKGSGCALCLFGCKVNFNQKHYKEFTSLDKKKYIKYFNEKDFPSADAFSVAFSC